MTEAKYELLSQAFRGVSWGEEEGGAGRTLAGVSPARQLTAHQRGRVNGCPLCAAVFLKL